MILRLLIIVIIAIFVYWLIKKAIPALRAGHGRRFLPLVMNPMALNIIKRAAILLLRIIFRR